MSKFFSRRQSEFREVRQTKSEDDFRDFKYDKRDFAKAGHFVQRALDSLCN